MAYDDALAKRIRAATKGRRGIAEKKMFGGLAFMVRGNMAYGIVGDELMVRVGPEAYDEALGRPHARPCDFTGRPMKGLVMVGRPGFAADGDLAAWLASGAAFVKTLPAK